MCEGRADKVKPPERPINGLRILMVSNQFAPEIGGVCAVTAALASHLSAHVMVAAPKISDPLVPKEEQEAYDNRFAFPVYRVPAYETEIPQSLQPRLRGVLQFAVNVFWTRLRAAAFLRRAIRNQPIHVVCIQTLSTYWIARFCRRYNAAIKIIFYLHGEEVAVSPKKRFLDRLKTSALLHADGVVAVSSFTHDLAQGLGVPSEKLIVVNNGVDAEQFTPGPKDPTIERRFGLIGKQVLLCLARLDERKGQDKLIEAMPLILESVPSAILLIVGGGSDEHRLRGLAVASKVSDSIIFAGTASDEERLLYYRTADVYAMPNRELESGDTEGFGLVFLEAGACGKPVIGGMAGGVPDAILSEVTGYLVDGRSSGEIALACIRLLSDNALATRFGENGLVHSRQNTWALQSRKFLSFCASIIEENSN